MSQIELDATERSESALEATSEADVGNHGGTSTALLTRPLLRAMHQPSGQPQTTWIESLRSGDSGEDARPLHSRRVGGQYLLQLALTTFPLVLVDLALLTISVTLARAFVRYLGIGTGIDISASFVPIAVGFLMVAFELGVYPGIRLSPVEEFRRLAVAVTAMFVMWTIGVVLMVGTPANQPVFLGVAYLLSLATVPVFRNTARRVLSWFPWWGFPTLVCGDDAVAVKVSHWIASNPRLGLRPVGVVGDAVRLDADGEAWYAGPWSAAHDIACQRGAYWAVVVPPEGASTPIVTTITEHLSTIPHVHILSELTGLPDHWSRHQQLDGLAGIHLQQNLMLPLPRITKRVMDLVLTMVGGIVLLPLLFYIAVAVKLSSRGPVLYANERIGRDGRRFRMWKFRSMFTNGDAVLEHYLDAHPEYREEWETTQKLKWDPRITRIGRFIRKTSLDELPQLWNVLRDEMSLVGPRPILIEEEAKYGDYYALYTMVKPGITGMWQVSGRSNTTYEERLQLVAYYVRNWSLGLDSYLLLKTVRIVFFGRGAY
jgi:Undecaprenyl-phosphate galactose phosphotransferase WbaP